MPKAFPISNGMNLVCIGLNHKNCPVEIREKIAFSESALSQALIEMRKIDGLREWFILSTCNRVELYGRGFVGIEESLIDFYRHCIDSRGV